MTGQGSSPGNTPVMIFEGLAVAALVEMFRTGTLVPEHSSLAHFRDSMASQMEGVKKRAKAPGYYDIMRSIDKMLSDERLQKSLATSSTIHLPGCDDETPSRREVLYATCPSVKDDQDCQGTLERLRNPGNVKECLKWDRWQDWTFGELLVALHALHLDNIAEPTTWRDEVVFEVQHLVRAATTRIGFLWSSKSEGPPGFAPPALGSETGWEYMRHGVIWQMSHPSTLSDRFLNWRMRVKTQYPAWADTMNGRTWHDWGLCRDFPSAYKYVKSKSTPHSDPDCLLRAIGHQVFGEDFEQNSAAYAEPVDSLGKGYEHKYSLKEAVEIWATQAALFAENDGVLSVLKVSPDYEAEQEVEQQNFNLAKNWVLVDQMLTDITGLPHPMLAAMLGDEGFVEPFPTNEGLLTKFLSRIVCIVASAAHERYIPPKTAAGT